MMRLLSLSQIQNTKFQLWFLEGEFTLKQKQFATVFLASFQNFHKTQKTNSKRKDSLNVILVQKNAVSLDSKKLAKLHSGQNAKTNPHLWGFVRFDGRSDVSLVSETARRGRENFERRRGIICDQSVKQYAKNLRQLAEIFFRYID